ncbi:hypothetical protein [Streptomyces sp. bgisy027]|uniref:hypothetical protein n=1 Tax=Streptomyces sp. bgisy027 TaxID=3413770 RepID=UPI003D70EC4C
MTQIHAELEELAPDARVRALAWLLVALRVDVVDVYQEAKRLGLTGQHGLVRGLPADEATG